MTDTVFALVSTYGAWIIFASAFLSCLALPIPTSLMMLSGGAFVSTGDLAITDVIVGSFAGAVLGDQTGYALGRFGGSKLVDRVAQSPKRARLIERARDTVDRRGGIGVFFSTWLFAPLGPWVNFIAGAGGLGWARFSVADILGEMIWVALYVSLGILFSQQITNVADIMGNALGLLAALAVAYMMVQWIRAAMKDHPHHKHQRHQHHQ